MAPERFAAIKQVFSAAVDLPAGERTHYLEKACATDAELRGAVDALLRADEQTAAGALRDPLFQPRDAMTGLSITDAGRGLPDCIGKYRLIRKLGEGGMGAVYEAEQDHPRRRVALKTIRPDIATQSLARWFSREAQLLGQLQHPGIAQIFEAGTHVLENGVTVPYFAMELVEGRMLDCYLRERNPPMRERLRLIALVCDAVCHAHQRGVIHRDLKPANILVNEAGEPKILDFGVARIIKADSATTLRTDVGQIVGTLGYMSPEQVSERPEGIDARADVYALGVIFYEAVAERPPYDIHGRPLPDAIRIIQEEEPTRLRFIDRRFRGDVETIAAKALEKDRRRRYATAAELAGDIRRHLCDEPIHARPTSKFYQLKKFARRNRGLVIGLGVAAQVLLAGVIVSSILAVRESQQRKRAEARESDARRLAYRASIAAANASLQTGDSAAAWTSLTQAPADLRGWEWRHLHYMADRSLHRIKEHGHDPRVSVSADGETLATVGDRPSIRIWDTRTGAMKIELSVPATSSYMALRPDGGALLWSDGKSLARLMDTKTGEILWNRDGGLIVSPDAFQPGGRIFAAGQANGFSAALFDAESGQLLRPLTETRDLIALPAFAPDGNHVLLHYGNGEFDIVDTTAFRTVWRGASWKFAFTPDGAFLTRVVSEASRWELWYFALASGQVARNFALDSQIPEVWAFRPGMGDLATADASGIIEIRDLTTHTIRARLPGHRGISSLRYSRDGRLLISTGPDGDVRIWDAALTAIPLLVSPPRYELGYAAALSRDGRRLARVGWGSVSVWDTQTGALCWRRFASRIFLHAVTFLADDTRLAVGGQRTRISLLDTATGETTETFDLAGAELVYSLGAAPDGQTLFAALDTGEIRTIAVRTGEQAVLGKHASPATCCAVGPDGAVAASGSGNGLPGNDFGVLATPANDRTVRLWTIADRKPLLQLEGHRDAVSCVAFDHDGGRVASGSLDQTVIVWNTRTGERLLQLQDTGGPVRAVAFSPDGSRIVAGCDDTLRIWSGVTGELLASLPCGVGSVVNHVAFAANSEALVASGIGLALAVFETAPPACRESARERAVRGKMLVDELQNRFELAEDIVAALDGDTNLPADLRAEARRHALRMGDPATRHISDAYVVAMSAHPSEADCRLALRKIESAARLVPDNWRLLSTLGLLEMRAGLTAQALDTLHRAEQSYAAHQMPLSTEFVVALVLVEHKSGDRDQARRRMIELNAALRKAPAGSNERLAAMLREANEMVGLAPAD